MEQPTSGARSGCGPGDSSARTREQIFMEHFPKMDEDIFGLFFHQAAQNQPPTLQIVALAVYSSFSVR